MFGMSSTEFWEDEPQLYWAYRFSYERRIEYEQKAEMEKMRFMCWLQGKTNEMAFSIALNNAFTKKKIEYPDYKDFIGEDKNIQNKAKEELASKLEGVTDREVRGQIEYNYWARL